MLILGTSPEKCLIVRTESALLTQRGDSAVTGQATINNFIQFNYSPYCYLQYLTLCHQNLAPSTFLIKVTLQIHIFYIIQCSVLGCI